MDNSEFGYKTSCAVDGECAISVIVPVFNTDEKFFFECIKSIINQSFDNFEVIVIDDGSDEGYTVGIKKAVSLDERIRLFREENSGVSTARNLALSIAKGEYVVFVDSDDILEPFFLEESYYVAKSNNLDMVIGTAHRTANLNESILHKKDPEIEMYSDKELEKIKPYFYGPVHKIGLKKDAYICRSLNAKLFKLDLAKQVQFHPDMKIGEDGLWILEFLSKSKNVCIVSQIWYIYRINPESVSCRYNPEIISQHEIYFKRILDFIDLSKDSEYFSYVGRIYEALSCAVYRNFIGHQECHLSRKERGEIITYLYTSDPWSHIGEQRYINLADRNKKFRARLYKNKTLFLMWDLKRKTKKFLGRD